MADKNVFIEPIPGGEGHTFYFPGCHVYLHLDKHLSVLEIPQGTISLDPLLSARTMRVVGTWKNDDAGKFDGLTAFARLLRFVIENETKSIIYQMHWSQDGFEEPDLYVKLHTIDIDRDSGTKGMIPYNIIFRKITQGE